MEAPGDGAAAKGRGKPNAATTWFREHVVASFETFGRQLAMFVEVFKVLIEDIVKRRFPFGEFIRQCAFMSSTSVFPTLLVAIPIGVIVSIQVSNIAGQIGATSFSGAATGLGVIRQAPRWSPHCCWPARWARRSPPTSAPARSATRSTR